jgi:predicted O-methyltransferase YrrM
MFKTVARVRRNFTPAFRCYRELSTYRGDPVDFVFRHIIRPTQIESEFRRLAALIQKIQPRYAMEIGTLKGGTLYPLCRLAHPQAQIISLDFPGGEFGGGYPKLEMPMLWKFRQPHQRLHLLRADSHSSRTKDRVTRVLRGHRLDYLFIDADHTYEGVKSDFEMYGPLVRCGGVIAFHDIVRPTIVKECKVDVFWNEVKLRYKHEEFIEDPEQGGFGIGVLYR